MRFSGPEAGATTPCAFDSAGITKTVKEKPSAPSARRIMDRLHVVRLLRPVCRASEPTQTDQRKQAILFHEKNILKSVPESATDRSTRSFVQRCLTTAALLT